VRVKREEHSEDVDASSAPVRVKSEEPSEHGDDIPAHLTVERQAQDPGANALVDDLIRHDSQPARVKIEPQPGLAGGDGAPNQGSLDTRGDRDIQPPTDRYLTGLLGLFPEPMGDREVKYREYKNPNYGGIMEALKSYMDDSIYGPRLDSINKCREYFNGPDVALPDPFPVQQRRFILDGLQSRLTCILVDLCSRLFPSLQDLSAFGLLQSDDLLEGACDRWQEAIPFLPTLPMPDRTVGFRQSALNDVQRANLGMFPGMPSVFSAVADMSFPFLTFEMTCAGQALGLADRANANSMSVALRAVVELFRRAGRLPEIHREILAFSISCEPGVVRIYGHYPQLTGGTVSYWRYRLRAFSCGAEDAAERLTTRDFVSNICTKFAPAHLERLREVIDSLAVRSPSPLPYPPRGWLHQPPSGPLDPSHPGFPYHNPALPWLAIRSTFLPQPMGPPLPGAPLVPYDIAFPRDEPASLRDDISSSAGQSPPPSDTESAPESLATPTPPTLLMPDRPQQGSPPMSPAVNPDERARSLSPTDEALRQIKQSLTDMNEGLRRGNEYLAEHIAAIEARNEARRQWTERQAGGQTWEEALHLMQLLGPRPRQPS
jgi:hypothetical protein